VADVDLPSVKKRLKEKAFARGVHREDVYAGAEEIGLPLDEHIANVIKALQDAAPGLGL
jgi:predicted hydrolase (HD superfamily)